MSSERVTQMFTDNAVALIDADSIYFRVACVVRKKQEIRKAIDYAMTEIRKQCMTDKLMVAVKGRGNFRSVIYPDYKGNRKALDPDVKKALEYGHGYMCEKYGAIMADDMEADDLVAIWAAECREEEIDYYVVGIDKDLLQIPGAHYNFVKKTHRDVDLDEAHLLLMTQALTGDNADNIPGLKGIGPKKAEKILAGVPMERRWNRVKAAWRAKKAGNPDMSLRLLTMLTSWEEFEDVKSLNKGETVKREQDVRSEGEEDV